MGLVGPAPGSKSADVPLTRRNTAGCGQSESHFDHGTHSLMIMGQAHESHGVPRAGNGLSLGVFPRVLRSPTHPRVSESQSHAPIAKLGAGEYGTADVQNNQPMKGTRQ